MYFNEKDDTNIDDELDGRKKEFKPNTLKIILIVLASIAALGILIFIIYIAGDKLTLDGPEEITIYQGTRYIEPGYSAKNIANTYHNDKVVINGRVDTKIVGTYTITYKYHLKTKTRTVKVIAKPDIATIIHLNGSKTMTLGIGEKYTEPGYNAIDAIDGDITSKIEINSNVDTSKAGTYRIIYSVTNSTGVTTSETRTIVVR